MAVRVTVVFVAFALILAPAHAQHQGGHGAPSTSGASPYAEIESRAIKAFSDQQVSDLRAGRGIGLALAAELNGYPGPLHVIELEDRIGLTPDQRTRMKAHYDAMRNEAVALGERLIREEADLDRLFAARTVTPASLAEVTSTIGATQAALREAHLRYHLSTVEVLTPEQVARYNKARGYRQRIIR